MATNKNHCQLWRVDCSRYIGYTFIFTWAIISFIRGNWSFALNSWPPPLTPGGKIWLTHTEESSSVSGLWADLRRCHLVVALVLASIKLDHCPTILAHWFPTNKNLLWGREHSSRLSRPPPPTPPVPALPLVGEILLSVLSSYWSPAIHPLVE